MPELDLEREVDEQRGLEVALLVGLGPVLVVHVLGCHGLEEDPEQLVSDVFSESHFGHVHVGLVGLVLASVDVDSGLFHRRTRCVSSHQTSNSHGRYLTSPQTSH